MRPSYKDSCNTLRLLRLKIKYQKHVVNIKMSGINRLKSNKINESGKV